METPTNTFFLMWKWLWNWVMVGGCKSLKCVLEKACNAINGSLKVIVVRTQKEEESCRESLNLLRECLFGCEQNVGRNMDDSCSVITSDDTQMEMRNTGN